MMARHDRQEFLGALSAGTLRALRVGVVGLGGGGSHVVQQLAHLGVGAIVGVDPDIVEDSNLNRLVGGTRDDVAAQLPKTAIAARLVAGLIEESDGAMHACRWQEATEALAQCDIIVGGVDSWRERAELEAFARRMLIPYIDMGMDVHALDPDHDHGFAIGGQVVLSMPGRPCLWCLGLLNDDRLAEEAANYGDVGAKPQVVWPNGVLASLAVGLIAQLVAPWMPEPLETAYLEFDGNRHQVATSNRLKAAANMDCKHYRAEETGDPFFDLRTPVADLAAVGVASVAEGTEARAPWWRRVLAWMGPKR
jgi:molybdopterin-synthase adenylyltransferase